MVLVVDRVNSKTYEGTNGRAVLTRNFGNKDRVDKWSVLVSTGGTCRYLARRADFNTAISLAKEAIK